MITPQENLSFLPPLPTELIIDIEARLERRYGRRYREAVWLKSLAAAEQEGLLARASAAVPKPYGRWILHAAVLAIAIALSVHEGRVTPLVAALPMTALSLVGSRDRRADRIFAKAKAEQARKSDWM